MRDNRDEDFAVRLFAESAVIEDVAEAMAEQRQLVIPQISDTLVKPNQ